MSGNTANNATATANNATATANNATATAAAALEATSAAETAAAEATAAATAATAAAAATKTTTIDFDIFIIKTVQEFMFFFSIMFILYYVKKKVGHLTKNKKDTEFYIVIGLIVLNVIVNTVKIIIFMKKILKNNCNFSFLNDDTKITIPVSSDFGGEVGST